MKQNGVVMFAASTRALILYISIWTRIWFRAQNVTGTFEDDNFHFFFKGKKMSFTQHNLTIYILILLKKNNSLDGVLYCTVLYCT